MRKLILRMSMSLDGFVAGPNGELDWFFRSRAEDSTAWVLETLQQAGIHAMGSRTFEGMVSYWPTSTDLLAAPMNDIPKIVFTRQESFELHAPQDSSPAALSWASTRIANGDLTEEIQRLKQEPGKDIIAHGGANFAGSLIRLGLVDEYRLIISPVALGAGLPLFSQLQKPAFLKLTSALSFRSGAVAHVYHPA